MPTATTLIPVNRSKQKQAAGRILGIGLSISGILFVGGCGLQRSDPTSQAPTKGGGIENATLPSSAPSVVVAKKSEGDSALSDAAWDVRSQELAEELNQRASTEPGRRDALGRGTAERASQGDPC